MAKDPTGIKGAAQVANSPQSRSTRDAAGILATMRKRLEQSLSAYSESRDSELDDLRFMAGSPDNRWQWPQEVLATRGAVQGQTINARPCLTINKLPQHVRQVTNDQRQNRPSGKVIPVDDKADIEVAEVFNGMVRHIEYMSDADVVYDTACDNQVTYGEGYFRILTEYCDETSFEQDLRLQRIRNSFSVYMDPHIQDPCGADAEYCFITEDMPQSEFERNFPNAEPISSIAIRGVGDEAMSQWIMEDTVRIAEYFYAVYDKATLHLYPNNQTAYAGSPEARQMEMMGVRPLRTREVEIRRIKWMKTNGYEILEENDWPGKHIPVIRVIGNEFEVDGRLYISGLVRNAKDAQRMYNYWVSQEAEMLALAPKAPFIGYAGQFEGYEHQWKTANTQNYPYLEINPDVTDGQGAILPLPARAQPPLPQTGLIQAKMGASDDIKSTTGYYDSSLGETSNERSGRAILARERQGDTGSYHYIDNLARAIRYGTRQLVDLIPKIYDTQRIARIIGIDGETSTARIDPMQPEPVREVRNEMGVIIEKIYNPSVGKYDVAVTTGPSYLTKRQEAMDAMGQILQANPNLWAVAGDLFVKNMDWPGAQEIAQRLQKTIEPRLLEDEEDPAIQAAKMENEQLRAQMDEMRAMLDNVQKSIEAREVDIKAYDAETKRISAVQAGMSPEQIQDIVLGTISGMMTSGDLVAPMQREAMMPPEMGMELPPQ
jgi:hypothetical protein